MAIKINITEKLKFEEKPVLVIKDKEIAVNNGATIVLQVSDLMEDYSPRNVLKSYELLFDEAEREKIEALKLSFKDFTTMIIDAMRLVAGDEEGEALTPAMT